MSEKILKIHFKPCEEIEKDFKELFPKKDLLSAIYRHTGRGYIKKDNIYVCEDHSDLILIAHEAGHSRFFNNMKHSPFFGVMNASGAFRWFINVPANWKKCFEHFKAVWERKRKRITERRI